MAIEQPATAVYLEAYYIDKYEVTNAQYGEFMKATGRSSPPYWNDSRYNEPNQPVVGVNFDDAKAYCEWAQKRLPTEAEWEKAARGTDGRHFPWGNETPTCEYAVWDDGDNSGCGKHRPWPVGSKPAGVSPYGVHDMAGNAWEWVNAWFNEANRLRVIRGGSWYKSIPGHLRTAGRFRSPSDMSNEGGGFCCARSLEIQTPTGSMALIPAGEYEMGNHNRSRDKLNKFALPVHTVSIDAFWMDVYELTNQKYCEYLNSAYSQELIEVSDGVVHKAGDTEPYCDTYESSPNSHIHWDGNDFTVTQRKEDHPMVEVSWYGAAAFANFKSAKAGLTPCYNLETWECNFDAEGFRLPTEAEWEKAARGGEHNPYFDWPWGNSKDGSNANYYMSGDPFDFDMPGTTPVGYYDGRQTPSGQDMANRYGLYDMAGNVFEWCYDWYDENYYSVSPKDNPRGPESGTTHVCRCGSWAYMWSTAMRVGLFHPDYRGSTVGFRLVRKN